jgi:enoyl-CoA hydratase/carnithine racemase
MSDDRDVVYEVRDRIAWLTIDRPDKRNALRAQTVRQMTAGLERAAADEEVRALCVTGSGDKSFCAGADLTGFGGDGTPADAMRQYAELLKAMARCPKPMVARVAGHSVGGGMGLMLSCDLAYAADDVKVGTPEVNVGLFPMMVAAILLKAGQRKKILEMIYTGATVSAAEGEAMGLLTRVHPRAELDAAVEERLGALAAKAPLALKLGRQALAAVESLEQTEALDHLCGQLARLLETEDAMEGMMAFMQKRQPVWKGR